MARFELQGHRGARGLFPENTLSGFAQTLALGVDAIEIDVAVTADGVPVIFHDVSLNADLVRGPDGAWLVGEAPLIRTLTRDALAAFDVGRARPGSRTACLHAGQVPEDGAGIPTLAAVFALVGWSGVVVDAELKTDPTRPRATVGAGAMVDAVLAAWEAAGRPATALRSFDWSGLRHARRRCPEMRLTWLTSAATAANAATWWGTGGAPLTLVAAEAAGAPWPASWAPDHATLTQQDVAAAHRLGLRVVPWTVNAPADIARFIAWGVDGLCTDRPDLARAVMREAGLLLPAPYRPVDARE